MGCCSNIWRPFHPFHALVDSAYITFYEVNPLFLPSRLNPAVCVGTARSAKSGSLGARMAGCHSPSFANIGNANVWRKTHEQGKRPGGANGREPAQNFIHEFVRRRLKTTARLKLGCHGKPRTLTEGDRGSTMPICHTLNSFKLGPVYACWRLHSSYSMLVCFLQPWQ